VGLFVCLFSVSRPAVVSVLLGGALIAAQRRSRWVIFPELVASVAAGHLPPEVCCKPFVS
jgi:hypothetical protein